MTGTTGLTYPAIFLSSAKTTNLPLTLKRTMFEHGFFTGMASAAGGAALNGGMCDRLSAAERIAVNAALGGIVSELGGGKFASGAMTAAYVMMFNELKHGGPTYRQLKKYTK